MALFTDIFDFNHDSELDSFEKAAAFSVFMNMLDYCSIRNDESETDNDNTQGGHYGF